MCKTNTLNLQREALQVSPVIILPSGVITTRYTDTAVSLPKRIIMKYQNIVLTNFLRILYLKFILLLHLQVKSDYRINHRVKHEVYLSTDQSVFYFAQGCWHISHVLVPKINSNNPG